MAEVYRQLMNGKAVRLTLLSLKPGFEDVLIPELAPIVESTRQITGCLVFDLYRLTEERATLALHEVWKTHDALEAYDLSPLRAEAMSFISRFLAQPLRSWEIEEVY